MNDYSTYSHGLHYIQTDLSIFTACSARKKGVSLVTKLHVTLRSLGKFLTRFSVLDY